MKDGKKIILRTTQLKNLRYNLRKIISIAVFNELEDLDMSDLMVVKNEGRDSENRCREKLNQLIFAYRNSICGCSYGGTVPFI